MATAIERELRPGFDTMQPLAASIAVVPPARFLCGCRDCAISREERALAVSLHDRGVIPSLKTTPVEFAASELEVPLHA